MLNKISKKSLNILLVLIVGIIGVISTQLVCAHSEVENQTDFEREPANTKVQYSVPQVYSPLSVAESEPNARSFQISPGALIVVAGRARAADSLQNNIHFVTNAVYKRFLDHGYPRNHLYYLATDLTLDADNDGYTDVDAPSTLENLEHALTT